MKLLVVVVVGVAIIKAEFVGAKRAEPRLRNFAVESLPNGADTGRLTRDVSWQTLQVKFCNQIPVATMVCKVGNNVYFSYPTRPVNAR